MNAAVVHDSKPAAVGLRSLSLLGALAAPVAIMLLFPDQATASKFDTPRVVAWALCMAGVVGLLAVTGWEVRGRTWGVLIDERNRYSLARLQMSLWTILVLSTLYVVLIGNIVRAAKPALALDFELDPNLVVLMGFSVGTFVLAPMALRRKAEEPGDPGELSHTAHELAVTQGLATEPHAKGQVLVKASPVDARLADLIRGESVGDGRVVDLPRVQMLAMTAVVVLIYAAAVARALARDAWVLGTLPPLSNTLLLLILVSHGGYLTGKLLPTAASQTTAAQALQRAQLCSLRASSLAMQARIELDRCPPSEPRHGPLRDQSALAQALAADVSSLVTRVSAGGAGAVEVAAAEGRLDALDAAMRSLAGGVTAAAATDAPPSDTVLAIQRKLAASGHRVTLTGVADLPTEQAIGAELARLGIERRHLHPSRLRYFEEVGQLL